MTWYDGDIAGRIVRQGPQVHVFGPWGHPRGRTRLWCPDHQQLHYATVTLYYDTWHISFDCGAFVDAGYGEWQRAPYGPRGGRGRPHRPIRKRDWMRWVPTVKRLLRKLEEKR